MDAKSVSVRAPRHRSRKHRNLTTAQAILAVAENLCASKGPANIRLLDIAHELGIESPSIYPYYKGLNAVLAALAGVAIREVIETHAGTRDLPFYNALMEQAERIYDLMVARPGLARIHMADLAVPGGMTSFVSDDNYSLLARSYELENDLLRRGVQEGVVQPMHVISFIAARYGPAMMTMALKDLSHADTTSDSAILKTEYMRSVALFFAVPNPW